MNMSAEEVARRLGKSPGYQLLTFRDVGLPYWEVPLKTRVLVNKQIPVLDEFVLKSVHADLRGSSEIGQFLGLPERVVEAVMGELVASGHLAPLPPEESGGFRYTLTQRGSAVLGTSEETRPEERTITLAYDGLRRTFCIVDRVLQWRPQDLKSQEILEIPAFPPDPPDPGPDETSEVAELLREIPEFKDTELLSVLGLSDKRRKFFVRAVALVDQSVDSGDISVRFAVDGRPSEAHDRAFALSEGKRKLGIVASLKQGTEAVERVLGRDLVRKRTEDREASALHRATENLRREVIELEARLDAAEGDDEPVRQRLESLEQRLQAAESALTRVPVRLLEVHEHPDLLTQALETAQDRLLIVSPWIRAAVVNEDFLGRLDECAERGVRISIGYGMADDKAPFDRDEQAERQLLDLADRHERLCVVRLGDTHAKVLLVDREFVVITSFNWLSFRGDARRPFRDERGTLVAVTDEIDRIYDDYAQRMGAVMAPPG